MDFSSCPVLKRRAYYGRKMRLSLSEAGANLIQFGMNECVLSGRLKLKSKEEVFFRGLVHADHKKVKGSLYGGQDPLQEIVADLFAQVLCRLFGRSLAYATGNIL